MSRTLKFRAWDKHQGYFLEDGGIRVDGDGRAYEYDMPHDKWIWNPHLIVMQYTGLKDENGHEIFEGDVLEIFERDRSEVIYDAPAYVIRLSAYSMPLALTKPLERRVLGNVYEHPDLLTNEKEPLASTV